MHTARARLRRIRPEDFDQLRRLEANEAVMRYTSTMRALTPDETKERMQRWIDRKDGQFGIWLAEKHDGHFVGWFMLKPDDKDGSLELGFMILEELWGQGLTTEIAKRLMELASSSKRKVNAKVHPANASSLKVLEKLGFVVVKTEGETVHLVSSERPKA